MDSIEELITRLKTKIREEKSYGDKVNELTEKLRINIEQVQSLENKLLNLSGVHTDKISELEKTREKISKKLTPFWISSLKDIRLLTDLWKLGFDNFPVRFEHAVETREVRQMTMIYGQEHRFEDWSQAYARLSDDELKKETSYFSAQLEGVRGRPGLASRENILRCTEGSLETEKARRREAECIRNLKKPEIVQKVDHWRSTE